ncbi:chemotaxis protein CheB [Wenzhouxiangella sp. EGI_FJ10305]|uniref:chemotaxis protein CheB n=1 Tax=Wenzhouxiangella sp. EGI_FJ10305 TaxID=3243768 RepID=UPI0035DBF395
MADQAVTGIVGIGASAGGLAALEQFLAHVPADSGLAYVVVQHLAPNEKTLLSELLQRVTTLAVHEARQGELIKPNGVYVIPPNTEIRVVEDRLRLASPTEPRGLRLPIDVLFSSLASARGENAIAVVLSGMGSDGTLGLQAVRAVGGLTVVQTPESAQFDPMPRSAIASGCADIVDEPGALPTRILDFVSQVRTTADDDSDPSRSSSRQDALRAIIELLQQRTGHDLSLYRTSTLFRRIERRLAIHGLSALSEYADLLAHNPQEADLLFHEVLIGVTGFFRDPGFWTHLTDVAIPELLGRKETSLELRLWCVGCSTGEEAYSLAMTMLEAIDRQSRQFQLQIFATDLNPDAIAQARRGEYPLSIASSVGERRLARFFSRHESYYQINKSIRDRILFAQHDVILDPPFTRLDVISCRNLLIYFDPQLQRRLLPLFHYSLRPGGLLLLGNSESVGRLGHLFRPLQPKLRLFQRQDSAMGRGPDFLLDSYPPLSGKAKELDVKKPRTRNHSSESLQAAADRLLLQVYAPAAVVLNQDADIVYISGRTGKYLEPAAGKANWNIHAMAREELRRPLATAIKKAAAEGSQVNLHDLEVSANGSSQRVDVTVQALQEPASLRGLTIVVFRDLPELAAEPASGKGKAAQTRRAAEQRHLDEIHALREESRVYREEAEAAQEELQSTNEELQSTNEELTTSKEELQSMNEELQTINSELQSKVDDLLLAESDMQNVLNSIEIAILFLDRNLDVRRYTDRAAEIINLRETDIGRPLSDLTSSLQYPDLQHDAAETLRNLQPSEKQIQASDERWFAVRILPYRRLDDVIDGVVITLVDITKTKELEQSLRHPGD